MMALYIFSTQQPKISFSLQIKSRFINFLFTVLVAAIGLTISCFGCLSDQSASASEFGLPPGLPTSAFRAQLSTSTEIIEIHTRSSIYRIPRNYIVYPDPSYPILRVTYPGLKPFTDETRSCLEGYQAGCIPVELRLLGGNGPGPGGKAFTNRQMLQNSLKNGQYKKHNGPFGYVIYSPESKISGIRIYVKSSNYDLITVDCFSEGADNDGVCDGTVFLTDGNAVRFFYDEKRMADIEKLEAGIHTIFQRFSTPTPSSREK